MRKIIGNSLKKNSGFTLVEVVVSMLILSILIFWIIRINTFFSENNYNNSVDTLVLSFGEYVSSITNNIDLPQECNIILWQKCYIYMSNDNKFDFKTGSPDLWYNDIWFFDDMSFVSNGSFFHDITYLGTWSISWINKTFYYYKVSVKYDYNKLDFYVYK